MFCRKCGKEIPDDSEFCPGCGEKTEPAKDNPNADKSNTSSIPGYFEKTANTTQSILTRPIGGKKTLEQKYESSKKGAIVCSYISVVGCIIVFLFMLISRLFQIKLGTDQPVFVILITIVMVCAVFIPIGLIIDALHLVDIV